MVHYASNDNNAYRRNLSGYSIGYGDDTIAALQTRRARYCAGFLLPHLQDGIRLLDCGCGPGSITVDLAETYPKSNITGVDIEVKAIEAAIALSEQRKVPNVTFMIGDVLQLPFCNGVFDAVFAHSLLMHLPRPVDALREVRRVVKPTGLAAVADPDLGARIWHPTSPLIERFQEIYLKVLASHGASIFYARTQRALLRQAGFQKTEGHSFSVTFGDIQATSMIASAWEGYANSKAFRDVALEQDWADDSLLAEMCSEIRLWGRSPESYLALLSCATLAWP